MEKNKTHQFASDTCKPLPTLLACKSVFNFHRFSSKQWKPPALTARLSKLHKFPSTGWQPDYQTLIADTISCWQLYITLHHYTSLQWTIDSTWQLMEYSRAMRCAIAKIHRSSSILRTSSYSSRRVSRPGGAELRSLCIKIGYSEPTRAESREGKAPRP